MAEVPGAGEEHGHPAAIGFGDDFGVADTSPGLDRGGRAGLGGGDQAVGERKEGVAGHGAAGQG